MSTTSTPGTEPPPQAFPHFSELPKEIRCMIWRAALPGPRIVYLDWQELSRYQNYRVRSDRLINPHTEHINPVFRDYCQETDTHEAPNKSDALDPNNLAEPCPAINDWDLFGCKSTCPAPNILHVCLESYEVVSKNYSRAFGTQASFPEIWFDFEIDTLYVTYDNNPWKTSDISPIYRGKVQSLVLRIVVDSPYWPREVRNFPNAKEVIIIRDRRNHFYQEDRAELVFANLLPVGNATFRDFWETNGERCKNGLDIWTWRIIQDLAETELHHRWFDITRFKKERVKPENDVFILSAQQPAQYRTVTTPAIKQKLLDIEKDYENWS